MVGTDAATGKRVSGIERLRASVLDIMTTPKGTRVMRRDYGSDLPRLVDAPINRDTLLKMYAATADALGRWEPEFAVKHVVAEEPLEEGRVSLAVTGLYLPDGTQVTLDGLVVARG